MSRKDKSNSLLATMATWTVVTILLGWGVYQMAAFRQTLLADARKNSDAPAGETSRPSEEALVEIEPVQREDAMPDDPELRAAVGLARESAAATAEAAPPTAEQLQRILELLKDGEQALSTGQIIEGRTALNSALEMLPASDPRGASVRQTLAALNTGIFLGGEVIAEDPLAHYVEIAGGDNYLKIGRSNAVPAALIAALNPSLNPKNLKPGTGVKVVTGPFHLRLAKSDHRLDLYTREMYVCSYHTITEEGNYLPRGVYRVKSEEKIQVGTKQWIGFEGAESGTGSIAIAWIYGSTGPRNSGGKRADSGSGIKLKDADLAQLYNTLVEGRSLIRVDP